MFTIENFVNNTRADEGSDAGIHIVNSGDLTGGWDPGLRRPYLETDLRSPNVGRVCVNVTTGTAYKTGEDGSPIYNAAGEPEVERIYQKQLVTDRVAQGLPVFNVDNASVLTKDQWIKLDATVLKAARQRMQAWSDLRAANTFGGFDGMATPILEHEIMTDPGEAMADMEGLAEGRNFQPQFGLQGLPLPITHSDFHLASRFLAASRSKGQPQDMIRGEMAGRRVGELIEKTLIGESTGTRYGKAAGAGQFDYLSASKVYGYLTHPDIITFTSVDASATMAAAIATTGGVVFLRDVVDMISLASDDNFYGPFVLYVSPAYDDLLDHDFKPESDKTIRQRVSELSKITKIQRLDYLTGDQLILVQMTEDVAQAVNGLEMTTVQWDTKGGMQLNFKVMAIQVPRLRSVYISGGTTLTTGIVLGTTS